MQQDSWTMADMEQLVDAQGRNVKSIFCRHCGSQFISAEKAERVEHEQSQAHFQKLDKNETVSPFFWCANNVWDFDNIAQTRVVSDEEEKPNVYLLCSDCEKGEPVAVRWKENEPFYISHSRVIYERPEGAPENGALPAGMTEEFVRSLIAQQEQQAEE